MVHVSSVCHPYLPYIFGVCTATPYWIVTQFHCIDCKTEGNSLLLILCSEWLFEHSYCKLFIHSTPAQWHQRRQRSLTEFFATRFIWCCFLNLSSSSNMYHVLTDFGKATDSIITWVNENKSTVTNFPHHAPEVINGSGKQTMSDMYVYVCMSAFQKDV